VHRQTIANPHKGLWNVRKDKKVAPQNGVRRGPGQPVVKKGPWKTPKGLKGRKMAGDGAPPDEREREVAHEPPTGTKGHGTMKKPLMKTRGLEKRSYCLQGTSTPVKG